MAKPIDFSRWASTGAAVITEPASGTKDVGYVAAGVPSAAELNWLINRGYLWEVWLDAFESTAHTWTAAQAFGTASVTNLSVTALGVNTLTVGSTTAFAGPVTFLAGSAPATFQDAVTFANTSTPVFNAAVVANGILTTNGALHVAGDLTVNSASVTTFNGTTTQFNTTPTFIGALPAATAASYNTLSAVHISKAWVHIACNGTATTTMLDGLNMNAAPTQVGSIISVVFKTPMANANYAVVANVNSGSGSRGYKCEVDSLTVNGFDITLVNDAGTFPGLAGSNPWRIVVDVKGRQ